MTPFIETRPSLTRASTSVLRPRAAVIALPIILSALVTPSLFILSLILIKAASTSILESYSAANESNLESPRLAIASFMFLNFPEVTRACMNSSEIPNFLRSVFVAGLVGDKGISPAFAMTSFIASISLFNSSVEGSEFSEFLSTPRMSIMFVAVTPCPR